MKKTIKALLCVLLCLCACSMLAFATDYPIIIDDADLLTSEEEVTLEERIVEIEENYNYHITLVSASCDNDDDFLEYVNNFAEYDENQSGAVLFFGDYGDSYSYYSWAYGTYSTILNDHISDAFQAATEQSEICGQSYKMYVALVRTFLENQKLEGNTVPEYTPPRFEVGFTDEAGLLSERDADFFERRVQAIYEIYGHRITLSTKDFNYSQSYPDYEKYDDDLRKEAKQETAYHGSIMVFAPKTGDDFYFIENHYGENKEAVKDKMFSSYVIADYAREEETIEDMCFYTLDTALNWVESVLVVQNPLSNGYLEEYIGIGGTIDGFDPMIDGAELFSEDQEAVLFARIEKIHKDYDFDVTLITVDGIPDDSYDLREYYDWYEGLDPNRDGLVAGVNMCDFAREFSISTRNFGMEAFNDDANDLVQGEVPPLLTDEQYFKAFNQFLDRTEEFLEMAKAGETYKAPPGFLDILLKVILLPLALAFGIAWLIVKFVFVAQMKTAIIKEQATDFMQKDSLALAVKTDVFSHETVERVYDPPKKKDDSSSGGGSSSSSGFGGSRGGSSSSF